jgi:transmembrane sensor
MKTNPAKTRADICLSDEAIDQLVRLHSGRATDADRLAWQEWRGRSDAHETAALEAETIWHGIGLASSGLRQRGSKSAVTRRAVIGGGIAVLGGGVLLRSNVPPSLFADHVTNVGEQRNVRLDDGSSILMNADTAISVNYSQPMRQMTLHRGQAKFTVSHDPARPFIVEASDGYARALGTVFDVDIRSSEVVVTTLEGSVEVNTTASPTGSERVEAGYSIRYDDSGHLAAAQMVDTETETAWQRGKLIFNRRPLGDVALELQRYRQGKIIITNSSLRSLEVSGVFDITDPDAVLDTLQETLSVSVIRMPFVTIVR